MNDFLGKLQNQLKRMTETEKDSWILSQAKILPKQKQEGFYKSICGTKKIINMPEQEEIDDFCKKVRDGDIIVQYETHYVEFDDYGHFHDDWEHDFYDPDHAMFFLKSVINGCHDMIILEDYEDAAVILDEIITLEFTIEDHPDTDDTCEEEFMDLDMAIYEGLLSLDREELLRDYIEAQRQRPLNCSHMAEKIVIAFEMKLFADCNAEHCITITKNDPLLPELIQKLEEDLERFEKDYAQKISNDKYYPGEFSDRERIRRIHNLMDFLRRIGKKAEKPKESFLRGTWDQILGLLSDLDDEPYIDDQVESEEIWNIVEALLKRGGLEKEPWEVKEMILKEIYDNDYYDYYGVCDLMRDLANALCASREENLKRAGIMMKAGRGHLGAEAAKLYRELGEYDICADYFENHLGREEEPYELLIDHYKDKDRAKAVEIAELGIKKCQKDQTSFFLFLLKDAKERGDDGAFRKLMQRAHRRRAVNSAKIDAEFS